MSVVKLFLGEYTVFHALTLTVAAFVVLAGCSRSGTESASQEPAQATPAKELIFNTYLPPGEAMRRNAVEDFSRRIEQESGGSIKIVIPDSTLAPSNRQWSVVTDGVADFALVATYAQREQMPLPLIADLPFNSISGESASTALWSTYKKYFESVNEFADVQLLSMYAMPPYNFISNAKPISKIDDFKGVKIWVSAGAPTDTVKALGGVPVYSPFPQLFEYASKGNVDAVMVGPGTVKQASIGDHVKYMSRIAGGFGAASFAIIMNKDTWASLSAEEQAAVMRAADGLPQRVGRALDERNRLALEELKLTVNDIDASVVSEVQKRVAPIEATWIAEAQQRGLANAAEALAFYRSEMAAAAQAVQVTAQPATPPAN